MSDEFSALAIRLGHLEGELEALQGGGGAHNNMQPTSFLNVMVKL